MTPLLAARGGRPQTCSKSSPTAQRSRKASLDSSNPLLSDGGLCLGFYKELIAIRGLRTSPEHLRRTRAQHLRPSKKGASEQQITDVANFETGRLLRKRKRLGFRLAGPSPIADPTRWTTPFTLLLSSSFTDAELIETISHRCGIRNVSALH